MACSDNSVAFVFSGVCEKYEKEAHFCYPGAEIFGECPEDYLPVCAKFSPDKCSSPECSMSFKNSCIACNTITVEYFTFGRCSDWSWDIHDEEAYIHVAYEDMKEIN